MSIVNADSSIMIKKGAVKSHSITSHTYDLLFPNHFTSRSFLQCCTNCQQNNQTHVLYHPESRVCSCLMHPAVRIRDEVLGTITIKHIDFQGMLDKSMFVYIIIIIIIIIIV